MRHSKPLWALTLIALALFLGAASSDVLKPSPRPTHKPSETAVFSNQQASQQPAPIGAPNRPNAPNRAKVAGREQDQSSNTSTIVVAISAVLSAVAAALIAWFNWQLVGVTRDMHQATATATEVAKENMEIARTSMRATRLAAFAAEKSAEAAQLSLNAARPYIFVEGQNIHFAPEAKSFAPFFDALSGKQLDATLDPLSHVSEWKSVKAQIWFELTNRGKSTAIIENLTVKAFLGYGMIKEPSIKAETIQRISISIPTHIVGADERTKVYTAFDMSLDVLDNLVKLTRGLIFLLRVKYRDVYRRHFNIVFSFAYEPPIRGADGTIMRAPQLTQRRRSKPRYL